MRFLKNDKGMTLIEVLVSIAIFAIVAIPLLGIFSQSAITSADSKIKTEEATIAQTIVENIKAGNITTNKDLENFSLPLGFNISIPKDPIDLGNGLMEYQIQVFKINSKLPAYTLYAIAPKTEITSYVPVVMPSEENQSGGNDSSSDFIKYLVRLITIIIIATWTLLFLGFVVFKLGWNKDTKNKLSIIVDTIIDMIKQGITSLKKIGIKASEIAGVKVPWWLKWW
ncbi:MAG TPA: prepilin-type N-terminal cleavage/methylation domain-containing protein [Clostridia bacterium]|nr:prepilin-type N-terminal cleavage/methylation domain-containing protein [Clostridia bacterium]